MGTQPDQQAYSGIERSKRIAVRQPGASDFGSAANLRAGPRFEFLIGAYRSEEHTSELQSLMRISYAVFCLKKKMTRIHIIIIALRREYTYDDKVHQLIHSQTHQ